MTDAEAPAVVVVVVEDDEDLRETLQSVLSDAGYLVHAATNGADALALIESVRPAVIITDLVMPGVDGWKLLEELDRNPELAAIPRLVMTAADNVGSLRHYVPVFVKPIRLHDLLRAVRAFLGDGPAR